jgi:protein TonB
MQMMSYCYLPHDGFEGRNQNYGAYVLRRNYSVVVSRVLLLVVVASGLLFGLPTLKRLFFSEPIQEVQKEVVIDLDNSKPIEDIKIPDEPKQDTKIVTPIAPEEIEPISEKKYTEIEIKPDNTKPDVLTTTEEMDKNNTVVGNNNVEGEGATNKPEVVKVDENAGTDLKEASTGEENKDKIFEPFELDKEAVCEGGIDAFRKELEKNVNYPRTALKKGTQGKVMLYFVVDEKGRMSNPKIIKDIGDGCGEAVLEAFAKVKMVWSPAVRMGKPVKSIRRIPVNFVLPK